MENFRMLTDKEKEIFECAKKIKEYCNSFEECYGCVFDKGICHYNGTLDTPEYWDLENIRRELWYEKGLQRK